MPKATKLTIDERITKILLVFLKAEMVDDGSSETTLVYQDIRNAYNFQPKHKDWDKAMSVATERGLIDMHGSSRASSPFSMTDSGRDLVKDDPTYQEHLKELSVKPMSNVEKHEQIKKLMTKALDQSYSKSYSATGCKIFDLLLEWESLTKVEAASMLNTQKGSHAFFYAWDYLKKKKLIAPTGDGSGKSPKFQLTNAAFFKPEDRPVPVKSGQDKIDGYVSAYQSKTKRGRDNSDSASGDNTATTSSNKKMKKEKDPNAPKKPLSLFFMFSKHHRTKIQNENPKATFGEMGKLIGEAYKKMTPKEKKHLEKLVEEDKKRYDEEMTVYNQSKMDALEKDTEAKKELDAEDEASGEDSKTGANAKDNDSEAKKASDDEVTEGPNGDGNMKEDTEATKDSDEEGASGEDPHDDGNSKMEL